MKKFEVIGLQTLPQIQPGDNLPAKIFEAARQEASDIQDRDVLIITSKVVSKAMNLLVNLDEVKVSDRARDLARQTGFDARRMELILGMGHEIVAVLPIEDLFEHFIRPSSVDADQARRLVREERAILVTRDKTGRVYTVNSGVDLSNHPPGQASFPPPDPDEAAEGIREEIRRLTGKEVAVIIADTELVPFGTLDLASGSSGILPRSREFAKTDSYGRPKFGGMDIVAHELTGAAALLFGQADAGIPVVIVRGYAYEPTDTENIRSTLQPPSDMKELRRIARHTLDLTAAVRSTKTRLALKTLAKFL